MEIFAVAPWEAFVYIGIGVLAGFFAGLLGIGGGAIIGPMLIPLFIRGLGIPPEYAVHIAVATASGVIVFTAFVSMVTHAKRGNVDWHAAKLLTVGAVIGGLVGAHSAVALPAVALKSLLIGFLLFSTVNLLMPGSAKQGVGEQDATPADRKRLPTTRLLPVSFLIGWVSAMLGVGGGVMTVPYLHYCGVFIRQAIGTSAYLGFPLGLAASIGYIVAGIGEDHLPAASAGYIYLPALLYISVFSIVFAYVGASLSNRLPAAGLQKTFAVLLILVSARLVFEIVDSL